MRYPLLDRLRGAAAVWVFLHHLVGTYRPESAPAALRLGYFGVPMFFVVSGYCMAAAGRRAVHRREPSGRFLLRRLLRIYPPFWAAVAVAVAVYAALPLLGSPRAPYEEAMRGAWRTVGAGEWVGVLTLATVFRPSGALLWDKFAPVNLAFWTLAIEVQFYAVVWVAVRAGPRFYAVLGAVTLASLPFLPGAAAFSSGWFLPFWPFFALGVGLYAAIEARAKAPNPSPALAWYLAVTAGLGLMAWGLWSAPLSPDGGRAMMTGEFAFAAGFAAVLWAVWAPPGEKSRGPRAVADYLGAASYSVYLLHVPLMLLVGHLLGAALPTDGPAFLGATAIGVCALVYPFYRWVERPFMTGGRPAPEAGAPKIDCVAAPVTG